MDQEHLWMGKSGVGWNKKESGDLQVEKCWSSGVDKVSIGWEEDGGL